MNIYEAHASLNDQGRVEVVGVPFGAGSKIHISWMIHLRLPRKHVLCVLFLLLRALHAAEPHKLAAAEPEKPVTVITNSIGMKLALIPAGTFLMGSPDSEVGRSKDDGPPHRVRITKPFYMGIFEVTQAEYERLMGQNPSYFSPAGKGAQRVSEIRTDRFPVERVPWVEARRFCEKLTDTDGERAAGRRYRLPTEAEWEYACRAGTDDTVLLWRPTQRAPSELRWQSPLWRRGNGA